MTLPLARDDIDAGSEPAVITLAFDLAPEDFTRALARVPRSNLLQSFAYGRAIRLTRQLMPRFGRILAEGETVGIVQIQEASALGLHSVVLDRGPLWFEDPVPRDYVAGFLAVYAAQFRPRIARFRRMMPELIDTQANRALLASHGFRIAKPERPGHQSAWIDVTEPEEAHLKRLSKGWRSALSQGRRAGLEIDVDESGRQLDWLLQRYAGDKSERGYAGPAPRLINLIAEGCLSERQFLLLRASRHKEAVAGILVLGHGQCATYQIGWTSVDGRAANAHHAMLWHAIGLLRDRGYRFLDLGGINPETASGVTRFKTGLGGAPYALVPIHR